MQDFEKLGVFYMGRHVDVDNNQTTDEPLLYDSKDLTTHAVVVGMTGSGKTGLCLNLLEEAGIDRIPAIVIDPKGDISNLLLTFPDLSPEDFRPWVDEGQASRNGMTTDQFAASEAAKWKKGLAGWGQDGERIRRLRDTVEMSVYTPGSNSGRPLAILKSFAAPAEEVVNDSDAFRDMISSAVSGLLALLGIDADPIRSREHILVSNIFSTAWSAGRDLDLSSLIGEIQTPPFEQVGIMDLDTFFPAKSRMELAMTMNNLLASPSFSTWMMGEPLNIKRLLHTEEGKPRISILSIAHLNDAERMFFVTILLNEVLAWMRTQAGTSSLRALLYMDEVFGYFPPTKNPPSKKPMLTLLKQARAFGLGVVLATQNPVDLDYKGLSNTGTWFLGRLQTERDKARVIEGLEGASSSTGAAFNRGKIEKILAGLKSRFFLMNNVHDDEPVVFETRWAMSYLRGPLTRKQLRKLCKDDRPAEPASDSAQSTGGKASAGSKQPSKPKVAEKVEMRPAQEIDPRRIVPNEVEQRFVELQHRIGESERLVYRPALFGTGRLHFTKSTYHVDTWQERSFLVALRGQDIENDVWDEAQPLAEPLDFDFEPEDEGQFAEIPKAMQKAKQYAAWEKSLKNFLYRKQELIIFRCKTLKSYSTAGETLGDFKVRLEQLASENRDLAVEKLRKKYTSKFTRIRDQIRRAEAKVDQQRSQYKQKRLDSVLSIGGSIMGALLGRKRRSSSSSMKSFGRAASEKQDVARAREDLNELHLKFQNMEESFNADVIEIEDKLDIENVDIEELAVRPRKSDISVEEFAVAWLPWRVDSAGIAEEAY